MTYALMLYARQTRAQLASSIMLFDRIKHDSPIATAVSRVRPQLTSRRHRPKTVVRTELASDEHRLQG